jgi:DNA repair exonuclease SbcCD ATPase subunit
MFAQKVQSIESQIQQLTEQLNQFRTLEAQLEEAVQAIARLREAATKFDADVEDEVSQALVQAVGVGQWVNLVELVEDEEPETETIDEEWGSEEPEITEEIARASILPTDLQEQILQCKTWSEMRALVLTNPEALVEAIDREPALAKRLVGQIATYINNVGRDALKDLEALPSALAHEVRTLLNSPNLTSVIPVSDVPYSKIQETARELYNFKTWAQIRAVLQGYTPATKGEILREMALSAENKTKTKFIENLPALIAKYCERGDTSDLEWLPQTVARKVEELLAQQAAA